MYYILAFGCELKHLWTDMQIALTIVVVERDNSIFVILLCFSCLINNVICLQCSLLTLVVHSVANNWFVKKENVLWLLYDRRSLLLNFMA